MFVINNCDYTLTSRLNTHIQMCVFSLTNKEHRYTHTHTCICRKFNCPFFKKIIFLFFWKKIKKQ